MSVKSLSITEWGNTMVIEPMKAFAFAVSHTGCWRQRSCKKITSAQSLVVCSHAHMVYVVVTLSSCQLQGHKVSWYKCSYSQSAPPNSQKYALINHLNPTCKPPTLCIIVAQLSGLRTETKTEHCCDGKRRWNVDCCTQCFCKLLITYWKRCFVTFWSACQNLLSCLSSSPKPSQSACCGLTCTSLLAWFQASRPLHTESLFFVCFFNPSSDKNCKAQKPCTLT